MTKNKKPHFLYLVEHENKSELKLMTESEAADYMLSNECKVEVWNIHSSFDIEPEMF